VVETSSGIGGKEIDEMRDELRHKYANMRESALALAEKFRAEQTILSLRRGDSIENSFKLALDELSVEQLIVAEEYAVAEEWEHGAHLKIPELGQAQRAKLLAVITELQHCEWAVRALKDVRCLTAGERSALVKIMLDAKDAFFASCALWSDNLDSCDRAALVELIVEDNEPFIARGAIDKNPCVTVTELEKLQPIAARWR
jgi:hypothetical protein